MKGKIILFLSVIILATVSCKKETVDPIDNQPIVPTLQPKQEQWGLAINYTAKWCSPCGSWGAPLIHNLAGMNKVVAVTNHASNDPMYNATLYTQMTSDRITGGGIPAFWVGDSKTSSANSTSMMTQLLNTTPIAGIDMKTKRTGADISIESQVKFFQAGSGDYYLSFWMLESGIDGSASAGSYAQAGTSDPNYKHDYVIRKAEGHVYGEKILTNPEAGKTFDKNFTMSVNSAWTKEVYVVAVLWKYDESGNPTNQIPKYKFINAFMYKE
jgi:hypothetical protein